MSTYHAYQVTGQRQFEFIERELVSPARGQVRLCVHSCGVCHTDAVSVEGMRPDSGEPVVPGHEIVGVIDAIGDEVTGWTVGERVGVGFSRRPVWCMRLVPPRRFRPLRGQAEDRDDDRRRLR